jgi:hypothetical protein
MTHKIINYCLLTANLVAALCIGSYVVRKTKELSTKEEIIKMNKLMFNGLETNKETMIVVGRSIWDINLETDCLYPLKYVEYAKRKATREATESTNPKIKEAWQNAAEQWEQAAHKWRSRVQNLKQDDQELEIGNIADLEETADILTAEMCANLAMRYLLV